MIGTTLLNRYRIDVELGHGGMGVVYHAHDTLLNRAVAIKVLNASGLGTAGKARLLAEAQAAAKLNHPNIVSVYDVGFADEAGNQPFIVMELVQGESLRAHRPGSLDEALGLARQICAALEHAHTNGIIHRDLKPENVVLTRSQTAKLMDFGLARTADTNAPRLTEEDALVGTFAYLAPELIQGQPASVQSDLYALGVMLYELVTGRPPFSGDTLMVVLSQHLHALAAPPSTHNAEISVWLDDLIASLLSKEPAERPVSAGEVLQRLVATDGRASSVTREASKHLLPSNNLPTQLGKFIGREKEIARLKRLLSPLSREERTGEGVASLTGVGARLITLTGSGGIGKTRLSIQVAQELLPAYPNGAWLVELAPLADPALVSQAVAAALDVREEQDRPLLTALTDYLREKTLLLVLDNCEHVIDACAQLAEHLLQQCAELRILASSREALGIEGETAVRVPSLSLPVAEQATPDTLANSEAVQLFVERAAVALPGFALTSVNAPAIAQVCRRLDGIALAIELAASRVKLLKVEQIAARLDDAFRLLTGGSRTALPRQQTLRATIDWSYSLLSESERMLLRRLSVFSSGWTLEAAEATCTGNGIDEYEILELLTQLVNKSLVVVEREQGAEARYRLLETVRQYAREKLADVGEGDRVRDQHLAYFLKLGEQAERELIGPDQVAWVNQLESELDNVRVALGWALERNVEAGLRLASALEKFWEAHGYINDGCEWLSQLLRQPDALPRTLVRAKALGVQSYLTSYRSDFSRARSLAEESLSLCRELGDMQGEALSLLNLGMATSLQDDHVVGRPLLAESVALYRELGDKLGMANALGMLGIDISLAGSYQDYSQARAYLEESLALNRELGHLAGIGSRLGNLGQLALLQGDYALARPWLEEGLAIHQSLGERGAAFGLQLLGQLAFQKGNYEQARAYFEESLSISKRTGLNLSGNWAFVRLGHLALRQGDAARARAVFAESQRQFKEAGSKMGVVFTLEGMASLAVMQKQSERAVRLFAWADSVRESIGDQRPPVEQADVDRDFAAIRTQLDEPTIALAQAEGRAWTMEQAIEYALEWAADE